MTIEQGKHKTAMDTWVKLSKELTSMPANSSELKKKEKECENHSALVKQLADALTRVETHLERLTQNLLFFFEENLIDVGVAPAGAPTGKKKAVAAAAPPAPAASMAVDEKKAKVANDNKSDAGGENNKRLNAFRKGILCVSFIFS